MTACTPIYQTRRERREATRARLLMVAVDVLIERGVSGTTTMEVQQRAKASRGALLHHFPTHAELLSATVAELVRQNEVKVQEEMAAADPAIGPLERGIRTLAAVANHPSYIAELELWAVARCDLQLRASLRTAERAARKDRDRVTDALFAPFRDRPGYATMVSLSVEFVRGMALSGVLRTDIAEHDRLLCKWIRVAGTILDQE